MINSKAIRTYIFDGDKTDHFGHFDIRPFKSKNLDGVVCDAFLPDPHKLKNNQDKIFITCKKSYRADDFGYSVINTVPYMMPDIILSHCSHATLWIIFRLLSYELGKEYLSLVNLANDLYADDGGAVATNNVPILCEKYGYNYALYDGKLKKAHYKDVDETLLKIKNKKCVSEDEFDRLEQVVYEHKSVFSSPKSVLLTSESLYAYVESEIPVYLVFDSYDLKSEYGFDGDEGSHSIVAIGHTMNKNGELADFIAHDVSFAPFVCISKEFVDEKLIDSIVILPSDINVRYERAKTRVKRILQFYEANLLHDSNKSRSKEEIMEELKEAKIDK